MYPRLWSAALLLIPLGCASQPPRVNPADSWLRPVDPATVAPVPLSDGTLHTLRRFNIDSAPGAPPRDRLLAAHAALVEHRARHLAAALAELALQHAHRAPDMIERERAFLTAARFAFAALFDAGLAPPPSPFDPAFQRTADIYNAAVQELAALATSHDDAPFAVRGLLETFRVQPAVRANALRGVPQPGLTPCSRYELVNLRPVVRPGLGGPLLYDFQPGPGRKPMAAAGASEERLRLTIPATLTLEFAGDVDAPAVDVTARLHDPESITHVTLAGHSVELYADFTRPLARSLGAPAAPPLVSLLEPAALDSYPGLFMAQPYTPGRIPIVLIHGLLSTPASFTPLVNELMADPQLRSRYQVWYFRYATGNPLPYSAALLRSQLRAMRGALDPGHDDPALDRIVLVGRSLGGLIAKMQVQHGAGYLWPRIHPTPIAELDIAPASKTLLTEVFEFEPLPFVTRVVFVVTPHRGAELADRAFAQFFSSLVRLPEDLTRMIEDLRANRINPRRPPGAISDLSPSSPLLQATEQAPLSPHAAYHSVLADTRGPGRTDGSDGIVPYASAHFEPARSEVILHATHGTATEHPRMALELARILALHLEDRDTRQLRPAR